METIPLRIGARSTPAIESVLRHMAYVEDLVARGGPDLHDYASFTAWLDDVAADLSTGRMSQADLAALRHAFGAALRADTLQGFSFSKPHGYPGDYEIIDRIYRQQVSLDPMLQNWDRYCHAQSGPMAVRNRKSYFVQLLRALDATADDGESLHVLNVASGPCRDLLEFFSDYGRDSALTFECVDSDPEAIAFAGHLCRPFLDRISFTRANALRFTSAQRYRLIWSAGLFDYLDDRAFKFLLDNLLSMLAEDGELVIGNFGEENPTRPYMEIVGDWHLYHRSPQKLTQLAMSCGIEKRDIKVGREPEGVNLFLHIKRAPAFLT